jgi:hypothetical protein
MPSCQVTLTLVGMALNILGGVMAAWPELTAPRLGGFWAAVRRRTARLERFGRRLLKRPRRYHMDAAAGEYEMTFYSAGRASPPGGADPVRVLAFLLRRDAELEERLNKVERGVAAHPGQWRAELQTARAEIEARAAADLERARDRFIGRRLVGLGLIAAGGVVLGIASLI